MAFNKMLAGLLLGNGLFSLLLTALVFSTGSFLQLWAQSFAASGSLLFLSLVFILPAAWMVGQVLNWSSAFENDDECKNGSC